MLLLFSAVLVVASKQVDGIMAFAVKSFDSVLGLR